MTRTLAAAGARAVRAPRGTDLSCKGWQQEAALRMLMNNLDPEVAEDPDHLIVYGGTGRAARSWEAFDAIVRELRRLADDETLLVQSGKPVGVFRTTRDAPRVLIANALLVPHWATWEQFRELERAGLMYGQMTAGSWIYIATQGIIQGTYETFAELARQHFGGSMAGTATLTAGLGGMGGAQPLAVTMNEGAVLAIEVDAHRAKRRLDAGYVDEVTTDLDEAIAAVDGWRANRDGHSVALVANAAEVEPELVRRGWRPDVVTDQTSAHDPLGGYVPAGLPFQDSYTIALSEKPTDNVTITVQAQPTRTPETGGIVSFSQQLLVSTDGVSFFARIKQLYPRAVRILLTGHDTPRTLTGAINRGEIHRQALGRQPGS